MSDERVNTANPDADKDLVKRRKVAEFQEKEDAKRMMENDFSRRFLVRLLLRKCKILSSALAPGERLQYLTGYRDVGLEVYGNLKRLVGKGVLAALEAEEDKMEVMTNA